MTNGSIQAPLWSYKLGLDNGWIPTDPRTSVGKCAALGVPAAQPFNGNYLPWQTGGEGAGDIPPSVTVSYPWPPTKISDALAAPPLMPQYTPTGVVTTLPPPTFTATNDNINGWYDSGDTAPAPTPISGCSYPNAWDAPPGLALPITGCSPGA
jgi:glucan 1,3-beta-glucosidase